MAYIILVALSLILAPVALRQQDAEPIAPFVPSTSRQAALWASYVEAMGAMAYNGCPSRYYRTNLRTAMMHARQGWGWGEVLDYVEMIDTLACINVDTIPF